MFDLQPPRHIPTLPIASLWSSAEFETDIARSVAISNVPIGNAGPYKVAAKSSHRPGRPLSS